VEKTTKNREREHLKPEYIEQPNPGKRISSQITRIWKHQQFFLFYGFKPLP